MGRTPAGHEQDAPSHRCRHQAAATACQRQPITRDDAKVRRPRHRQWEQGFRLQLHHQGRSRAPLHHPADSPTEHDRSTRPGGSCAAYRCWRRSSADIEDARTAPTMAELIDRFVAEHVSRKRYPRAAPTGRCSTCTSGRTAAHQGRPSLRGWPTGAPYYSRASSPYMAIDVCSFQDVQLGSALEMCDANPARASTGPRGKGYVSGDELIRLQALGIFSPQSPISSPAVIDGASRQYSRWNGAPRSRRGRIQARQRTTAETRPHLR